MFDDGNLHPFLQWLGEFLDVKAPELKRPTVVAAIYGTFIKNVDEAKSFWASVARGGVEYDDTHPTTLLDACSKRSSPRSGRTSRPPICTKLAPMPGMRIAPEKASRQSGACTSQPSSIDCNDLSQRHHTTGGGIVGVRETAGAAMPRRFNPTMRALVRTTEGPRQIIRCRKC